MRGKGLPALLQCFDTGITPAYAGKSARWIIRPPSPQDHPRLCGEKNRSKGNAVCVRKDHPRLCGEKGMTAVSGDDGSGSPPPMRGKVHQLHHTSP